MPTVNLKKDLLFKALGRKYTDDDFFKLCFDLGVELDEVTSERQLMAREQGAEQSKDASDEILYKIDIPANRYDLLCLEGVVNAILIFQGKHAIPEYIASREPVEKLIIRLDTKKIRPFAVAAVLRNITFNSDSYNSFIDLQDKLHQNLCRKRSLVAIGTHDLDTIKGPFVYDALPPKDIKFIPLNQKTEYTGEGIMELYAHHAQLKQYLGIIKESSLYPIIKDSNGVVLSMPPIINGDHSKITLNTKNVFIECTATDRHKAEVVLDMLVCMFSTHCKEKYHAERVAVEYPDGTVSLTPKLTTRTLNVDSSKLAKVVGIDMSRDDIVKNLARMGLNASPKNTKENSPKLHVVVPPTRQDVLHERDIVEDLAIAVGYNNIPKTVPVASTVGKQLPLNQLSDMLREEVARCGFTEALTFTLCSTDDISKKLGKDISKVQAVHVSNPKTLEFQVARTELLPCLLKTIAANKKMPIPLRIFEVSDVVLAAPESEVGAINVRRLGAVNCSRTAGFEVIHGLLDRIFQSLSIPFDQKKIGVGYHIRASNESQYFPKRSAEIVCNGKVVGTLGVLHPQVLKDFELTLPCAALELDVEPFL